MDAASRTGCASVCPKACSIFAIAGKEIEEQRRMLELHLLALAQSEDPAEQLFGLAPIEEVLLIGRALVGVAG